MSGTQFVILTGASGAGKTTLAKQFASLYPDDFSVRYFDTIEVPDRDEMIAQYGSVEAWQLRKTHEWFAKLVQMDARCILFEGQSRIAFLIDAMAKAGVSSGKIVLVDCDDVARAQRLKVDRGQSEAEISSMLDWANYLRREAALAQCAVLDTSSISVDAGVDIVRGYFHH